MSEFDTDFAAADAMFAKAFGVIVTYVRGATEIPCIAEVESVDHEATGDLPVRTIGQPRAFRIPAASLEIAGSPIEPRPGDKIKQTIGSTVQVFGVMPRGDEPCAKKLDPDWFDWLVHTKYVGVDA